MLIHCPQTWFRIIAIFKIAIFTNIILSIFCHGLYFPSNSSPLCVGSTRTSRSPSTTSFPSSPCSSVQAFNNCQIRCGSLKQRFPAFIKAPLVAFFLIKDGLQSKNLTKSCFFWGVCRRGSGFPLRPPNTPSWVSSVSPLSPHHGQSTLTHPSPLLFFDLSDEAVSQVILPTPLPRKHPLCADWKDIARGFLTSHLAHFLFMCAGGVVRL